MKFWRRKPSGPPAPPLTAEQERKLPVRIPLAHGSAVITWDRNFVTFYRRYLGVDRFDRRTPVYEYTYAHDTEPFIQYPGGRDVEAMKARLRKRYGKYVIIQDHDLVRTGQWRRSSS